MSFNPPSHEKQHIEFLRIYFLRTGHDEPRIWFYINNI